MKVHVVHGILTPVGQSSLLELVPYLQRAGFECRVPDYGLITACETKIANPLIWRTLLPYIEPGDLFVGHSNGCAIGYDLSLAGAKLAGLTLIDAALERSISLPPDDVWADCYFNEGDVATEAAVVAERCGLVDPVWGEMGHAGYDGKNPLITNIDCGHTAGLPPVSGHSDIFTPKKVVAWAPFIVDRIHERLKGTAARAA